MPSCENQRYIEDLIMGENGEIDAHKHLNARFGELKRTTYTYARIDYTNDEYIVELKTRSCNHNAFDRDGGIMFNYSKIKDYQKKKDKRKLIFAFNCEDGIYCWEYKEDNYTTGIGGRTDRGCKEIRKMAKVHSRDMECLYKKPNPFDTYCFISSDED